MSVPKIAEAIADQWRGLKKFAADLACQLPAMTRRADRGLQQNISILESWLRAALLTLADRVVLPVSSARQRAQHTGSERNRTQGALRRAGFRVVEPDAYERGRAAENRFDISAHRASGAARELRDQRPLYHRRLQAIERVLEAPEQYARRVKRKLAARAKRPNVKQIVLTHRSALPDLLAVPRRSDLGRYIWYNDSS